MSISVKINEMLNLNLQLELGETDKFPQAVLRNADEALLGIVDLTHSGNGKYFNDSFPMPNTKEVTATFIIYEDAAHTEESCDYGRAIDVFTLDTTTSLIQEIKQDIDSILNGSLPGETLTGIIYDQGLLTGFLAQDDSVVIGIVEQDNAVIVGNLFDENVLCGQIEDNSSILKGYLIKEENELSGQIQC